MPRNSSGTHTNVSGNPVVSGTAISSTWGNATVADFSAEVTDSLSRSGKGAMTAPLQCASGTSALPGATFSVNPDSGLYATASQVSMAYDAVEQQRWQADGIAMYRGLALTNSHASAGSTLDVTAPSATNAPAIKATGTGSNKPAIEVSTGNIKFIGAAIGVGNFFSKKQIPQVMARFTSASGVATIASSHGLNTITFQDSFTCRLAFAYNMANTQYFTYITAQSGGGAKYHWAVNAQAVGTLDIVAVDNSGANIAIDAVNFGLHVVVIGEAA